jgi:predicted nucleotidyltransferase
MTSDDGASLSRRRLAVEEFVRRVRETLPEHIVELRLFGSEARGDAAPDSDIDVFVVVQPDEQRAELETRVIDIAFDVNLAFGVFISPTVTTPTIVNHPVWRETPFMENVLSQGVRL